MSPRISFGRWTLRDSPRSKIALVGMAMILIGFAYSFSGWAPPWLKGAMGLHVHGGGTEVHSKADDDKYFLGSIIISPRRGDKCLERGLDNRNGLMWDKGYVNCDVVAPLKSLQGDARGLAARRLKAIGKAFTPGSN